MSISALEGRKVVMYLCSQIDSTQPQDKQQECIETVLGDNVAVAIYAESDKKDSMRSQLKEAIEFAERENAVIVMTSDTRISEFPTARDQLRVSNAEFFLVDYQIFEIVGGVELIARLSHLRDKKR